MNVLQKKKPLTTQLWNVSQPDSIGYNLGNRKPTYMNVNDNKCEIWEENKINRVCIVFEYPRERKEMKPSDEYLQTTNDSIKPDEKRLFI